MNLHMLTPAAALIIWTLVMMIWMFVITGSAYTGAGLDVSTQKRGSRGQDLTGLIPAKAQWPAHNYVHLLEQPTIFYPIVIMSSLTGAGVIDIAIAWTYVALRIAHSIWQATVNKVPQRFFLFIVSSACLAALAVRSLIFTL